MRKYLLNLGVLSSFGSAFGLVQATKNGPRDWRLLLMWIGWAITVALAISAVSYDAQNEKDQLDERAAQRAKKAQKSQGAQKDRLEKAIEKNKH